MNFNYKIGDKAIIIQEICGHQFELGELVKIVDDSGHPDHFQASNGIDTWYVSKEEIIPYEIIKQKIQEVFNRG
ncbi:hypothetical protein [Geobacillus phage GR1]|nr:hypothetical protein [Geobacillus phage GR1]